MLGKSAGRRGATSFDMVKRDAGWLYNSGLWAKPTLGQEAGEGSSVCLVLSEFICVHLWLTIFSWKDFLPQKVGTQKEKDEENYENKNETHDRDSNACFNVCFGVRSR